MTTENEIVGKSHWDGFHTARPRLRLPSLLVPATRNLQALLGRHIKPRDNVLEIGFAPGKQLAYVASHYQANVSGIDFSRQGVDTAQALFDALGIAGNLICDDIFKTKLTPASFDVVYSVGVIEHFKDPAELVNIHLDLLRTGGCCLIFIPNYGGVFGRLQGKLDPANLAIHNLDIMSTTALEQLVLPSHFQEQRAYFWGRFDSSILSWERILPARLALLLNRGLSLLSHLQPVGIPALAPWIVLEIHK